LAVSKAPVGRRSVAAMILRRAVRAKGRIATPFRRSHARHAVHGAWDRWQFAAGQGMNGETCNGRRITMTKDDLVGVYRGLGEETVRKDGTVVGSSARNSQIVYTADGYMNVLSTLADRKAVDDPSGRMDINALSTADRDTAASNVVAYAGRYEVKDGSVYHHIEMALNPALVGATRARRIHIDGDNLTLTSVPDADGSFARIRWRRVR
jgi:hypothetical protein